jgi:hypothetical protein
MQIFLSYDHADRRWANEVRFHLSAAGFIVWDEAQEVLPGDNWARAVANALDRCDAMVVLLSPEAAESPSVRREIDYALGSKSFKGRLVPVVVRATSKIPWILRTLPLVHLKADAEKASKQIVRILRQASAAPSPNARAASN